MLPNFAHFPVPAVQHTLVVQDSYWREFIPGTQTRYARGYHYGIDIPAPEGSAIVNTYTGVVVAVGNVWGSAYGTHCVLIRHRYYLTTFYTFHAHCSESLTFVGAKLAAGHYIALVGAEGNATGPHDHIELHSDSSWTSVYQAKPQTSHSQLYNRIAGVQKAA
jgi:murein DD-endopeptidase MepM/ murein hydrolase activator NlpD